MHVHYQYELWHCEDSSFFYKISELLIFVYVSLYVVV